MTKPRRRNPHPAMGLRTPYQPITGKYAPLKVDGEYPYCAMMQVAVADTHADYVVCRGHDPRVKKFFDYVEDDPDKIGISVAKPYGNRQAGLYQVGQIFAAVLPLTRIGQNPGVAADSQGHPADLDEEVELLYDDNDVSINWLLIDSGGMVVGFTLTEDMGNTTADEASANIHKTWDAATEAYTGSDSGVVKDTRGIFAAATDTSKGLGLLRQGDEREIVDPYNIECP